MRIVSDHCCERLCGLCTTDHCERVGHCFANCPLRVETRHANQVFQGYFITEFANCKSHLTADQAIRVPGALGDAVLFGPGNEGRCRS
jgi:hypothetical protein